MIWATVSSQSCFCWLYRASLSLAAKNIINLILVLTVWWCPCVESSLVLLEEIRVRVKVIVHGILQVRVLEWVAFPFSRGSSQPSDRTRVSPIALSWVHQGSHQEDTREVNWGLLHCKQILYQLTYQGNPGRLLRYGQKSLQITLLQIFSWVLLQDSEIGRQSQVKNQCLYYEVNIKKGNI